MDCTRAIVYNTDTDAWSERPLVNATHANIGQVNDEAPSESWDSDSNTWDTDTSAWNQSNIDNAERLVFASATDDEFRLIDVPDLETLDSYVAKHDMSFEQPERVKFLRRLHLRAEKLVGNFFVRVGGRMSLSDSIAWQPEVTVAGGAQVVNVSASGRYLSLEIRTDDVYLWHVTGVDLEVEFRGYH